MKRQLAAVLVLLTFLAGCSSTPTTGVEPGDGPAAAEPSTPSETAFHGPMEGEGDPGEEVPEEPETEEPTEEPEEEESEPEVATFKDKYTYEDGVEVEVTRIRRGKVTRADTEYSDDLKAGQSWVQFTVRVRNGSKKRLDAVGTFNVTYGPDGEEAESVYADSIPDDTYLDGKILPRKAKVASSSHLIPAKYQDDVVLEFSPTFEHEAAIFAGSVK